MLIDGHTAVVAGGGSGLGAATARRLALRGARVAIFDRDSEHAEALAREIEGKAWTVDVSDADAVGAAMDAVSNLFEPPRIAINCAGVGTAARIVGREGKLSVDMFEQTLRINLFGTYNVMSHAAKHMMTLEPLKDGECGVIINTASIAYEDGQLGQVAYAASKGAIASMCLPAAREFARAGIRVVAIAPGLFNTPMMAGLPEETTAQISANIPFPARLGDPDEYALMAEQIIGNPYLNGTTIRLDGATRLPPR